MHDAFARERVFIEIAYTPSGRTDYIYETGRLLARADVGGDTKVRRHGRGRQVLPGSDGDKGPGSREQPSLVVLSIE